MRHSLFIAAAVLSAVISWLLIPSTLGQPGQPKPLKVSYRSIPEEVVITGRFDRPLGTIIHIRGIWRIDNLHYKDEAFEIIEVDGKTLSNPVFYYVGSARDERPPDRSRDRINGSVLEATVYESATFAGSPAGILGEELLDIPKTRNSRSI